MKRTLIIFLLFHFSFCGFAQQKVSVYFPHDKYELGQQAQSSLDSLARRAAGVSLTLSVRGYTDGTGTPGHNETLAQKRAEAVKAFLKKEGIADSLFVYTGKGAAASGGAEDPLLRKVEIEIHLQKYYSSFGQYGTEVISERDNPITIAEYFSTERMLKDSVYAIDDRGDVLVTGGMIRLCIDEGVLDKSGRFYTVKIPVGRWPLDTAMRIWEEARDSLGQLRWVQSTIKILPDPTGQFYIFKLPVGGPKCRWINVDRRCPTNCMVYVTTWKPFSYTNVVLASNHGPLRFSAKTNDSTWAFSGEGADTSWRFVFEGTAFTGAVETYSRAYLETCPVTIDQSGNEHYFICDTCFYKDPPLIAPAPPAPPPPTPPKKRRRSFWQWLGDLFR